MTITITDSELQNLAADQAELDYLRKRVRELEASVHERETDIIARLKDGALVLTRRYTVALDISSGVCAPKWKEIYLRHFEQEHGQDPRNVEAAARAITPIPKKEILVITQIGRAQSH